MGEEEQRFRDGTGERYLKNGKVRCHGSSKTKVKQLRVKYADPTLRAKDLWPEAQCSWPAIEGAFGCDLHGGASHNTTKKSISDWMPIDLREKLEILEGNKDQLFNRDNEIGQLLARNAQLYESLDDLVLGIEGYQAVAEARKKLTNGDVVEAGVLLDIALQDYRKEREVRIELRENVKILDKLTLTVFGIRKELKLLATIDQVRSLLEGLYRGFERIALTYIPDERTRGKAIHEFATLLREQSNARHVVGITDGK